jgi:hypothetical protein
MNGTCPKIVTVQAFYPVPLGISPITLDPFIVQATSGRFRSSSAYIFTLDLLVRVAKALGDIFALFSLNPYALQRVVMQPVSVLAVFNI